MTVELSYAGQLLAADAGARTITYRLLPYGEQGRTSLGLVTVDAGVVQLPEPGAVVLNMEHDRLRPVGRASALVDDGTQLVATFTILDTTAGNDLLAECAAGVRPGVSVELSDVAISNGRLTAGRLTGAGAVVAPAFPSALAQLVASDTEPSAVPATVPAPEQTESEPTVDALTTPDVAPVAPMLASVPAGLPATPAAPALGVAQVNQLLASAGAGDRTPDLMAALSDLTQTANAAVAAPQWLAEVWSGNPYTRRIVPLVNQATLTAPHAVGWRWKVEPAGATYAGDKGAVPSNAAVTEAVTADALRWAGAHDVDRALRDFGNPGFWSSYWAAMAASYSKWSDAGLAAAIVADAPAVTPDGTGVVAAIVKAVLAVIDEGTPTFCLLGETAYAEMAERDPLAFLSGSISLPNGQGSVGGLTFQASKAVATDQVVVGDRNAVTWYELGASPIRVDALNVANGGVDVGAFGYGVHITNHAKALAKATVSAPAPASRKA